MYGVKEEAVGFIEKRVHRFHAVLAKCDLLNLNFLCPRPDLAIRHFFILGYIPDVVVASF